MDSMERPLEAESSRHGKIKRITRACDACRRRKIRCAGPVQERGNRCISCDEFNEECTFTRPAKKRGPRVKSITAMQERVQKLESLMKELHPELDISSYIPGSSAIEDRPSPRLSDISGNSDEAQDGLLMPSSDEEEEPTESLADWLTQVRIDPLHPRYRFGSAGSSRLVERTVQFKEESFGKFYDKPDPYRRDEFYALHPWEKGEFGVMPEVTHSYSFPEHDLLHPLIEKYFSHLNAYYPLLHKPTFVRAVINGLHLRDPGFGQLLLAVCATSSRFTEDPRVLLPGCNRHSAGWKWFSQIGITRQSMLRAPSLYHLQVCYLSIQFLQTSSVPHVTWNLLGSALRMAQDLDLHRKKIYKPTPNAHDELWKRVFWLLVLAERGLASELGRPCALHAQDIDAPLPIECDDEYWETQDPAEAFKQPAGKPSRLSAMLMNIKLREIHAYGLRTILAVNKARAVEGPDPKAWEQRVLAQINSDINRWLDLIPPHLKWDAKHDDLLFFCQSASLHLAYHHLIITIHRPFLMSSYDVAAGRPPNPVALVLCSSAARSTVSILEKLAGREVPDSVMAFGTFISFTSAIILLLAALAAKRANPNADVRHHMTRVEKCVQLLRAREDRLILAGRFCDILQKLAFTGNIPLEKQASNSPPDQLGEANSSRTLPRSGQSTPAELPSISIHPAVEQQQQRPVAYDSTMVADSNIMGIDPSIDASLFDDKMPESVEHGYDYHIQPTVLDSGAGSQPLLWEGLPDGMLPSYGPVDPAFQENMPIDEQLAAMWSEQAMDTNPADWGSIVQALRWPDSTPSWYDTTTQQSAPQ